MSKRGEVRRRAGIGNGMKATDDEKGNNRRKSTGVKEKTEPSRIPKRGKGKMNNQLFILFC